MSPWARLAFAVSAVVAICILSATASPAHAMAAGPERGAIYEIARMTSADLEGPLEAASRLGLSDHEDGELLSGARDFRAVSSPGPADQISTERTRPVRPDRPPRLDRIG